MGLSSGHGEVERWQSAVLRGLSSAKRSYHQGCPPSTQDWRPPGCSPWGKMVLYSGPKEWVLAGAYCGAGQRENCVSNQQRAAVWVQPGSLWSLQRACHLFPPHGSSPGRPPLGDVPLLPRRHYCLFFHLGRTPRLAPRGLRETEARQAQTGGREVHLRCQGGQLPGPPGDRGGPSARSFAPGCNQGYSTPENSHGSSLFPRFGRLLPPVRQGFCRHRRTLARSNQERRALPLERGLPGRLWPTVGSTHHESDHSLPRL